MTAASISATTPNTGEVATMISATMPAKRKRGSVNTSSRAPAGTPTASAATLAVPAKGRTNYTKTKSAGPRAAPAVKAKKPVARVGLAAPPSKTAAPPPVVPSPPPMASADAERAVRDAPTEEFMNVLNGSAVDGYNCIPTFDEPVHIEVSLR
nr:uncharacterized protein LOC127310283 [Lolium perenne]